MHSKSLGRSIVGNLYTLLVGKIILGMCLLPTLVLVYMAILVLVVVMTDNSLSYNVWEVANCTT